MISEISERLCSNISKVIIGKKPVINKMIISLICDGHILLDDIPGTGKTTLAKALALSIDCDFKRIQFTPDLLPSDITGIAFYNQKEEDFVFRKGAVATNILLADEINRATPRTQSSLLECMEEGQVTVDGVPYELSKPFLVIATQNPVETQGTFPLPEAQLDRFLMCIKMGYPEKNDEKDILTRYVENNPIDSLKAVTTADEIIDAQAELKKILVSDAVKEYILNIADATRSSKNIKLGLSPRGSIALMRASQGFAGMNGRTYVLPDDVRKIAGDVVPHRLIVRGNSISQGNDIKREVFSDILKSVPVPKE